MADSGIGWVITAGYVGGEVGEEILGVGERDALLRSRGGSCEVRERR